MDIRRECGLTISQLAQGIYDLPDDAFYEVFYEFTKLQMEGDFNEKTWIENITKFLGSALNEIKPTMEPPEAIWAKYLQYLKDWADTKADPRFMGCCPVCFDEWRNNDLLSDWTPTDDFMGPGCAQGGTKT